MPFCPLPFTHLNIKHEGKVSACWRYPDKLGDYRKETLTEIWNSSEIKELRRSMLEDDELPIGCRSCIDAEKSNSVSTRQQALKEYDVKVKQIEMPLEELKSIEVRFDNICNLMCRHCSPDYSSMWEHGVKKDKALFDKMQEFGTFRKEQNHINLTQNVIDEVVDFAPHLNEILIAGGEPLIHDLHYDFIERISEHGENITLSYNSNLTKLTYKNKNILDLWKKFNRILLRVSLDGDRDIYDYVRTSKHLPQIEDNIKKVQELDNVHLSITCTTSLLNITRFTNIINYVEEMGCNFHTSLVQYPRCLNIKLLPKHLKEKVTEDFYNIKTNNPNIHRYGQNVIDYMNSEDWSDEFHTFLDYSKSLDRYHKTDLFEVYPEFKL